MPVFGPIIAISVFLAFWLHEFLTEAEKKRAEEEEKKKQKELEEEQDRTAKLMARVVRYAAKS